jgi:hypothetical protein
VNWRLSREFGPFTREFGAFTREFGPFTREFPTFTREFGAFTRDFCRSLPYFFQNNITNPSGQNGFILVL